MIERYTKPEMGHIWTEYNEWDTMKQVEILASEAQAELGNIPKEAAKEIREKAAFSVDRIHEIEAETHHDIAAFVSTLSENIGEGEDVEYKLMLNYIAMNHHVSLDDLCGQFHRSRSYISHMFGKKCGMTLPAYCNRLKIEDAKELLKKTDMPITEIAYSAGFGDVSYFINLFGKMTGITPLKWRKLNK